MKTHALKSAPGRLSDLRVGALLVTARLTDYGTKLVEAREERVVKLTDSQITVEDGARYSRTTGLRHGDGGLVYPRFVYTVKDRGPINHPVLVKMDRVGRNHDVEFTVDWDEKSDLAVLADVIARKASRHLMSSDFLVSVDEDGGVWIDAGRFGTGKWARVTS